MAEFEKPEPIIKKIKTHAASLDTQAKRTEYLRQVMSTSQRMRVAAKYALADMERFEHEEKDEERAGEFMKAFPNDFIVKSLAKADITVQVKTALNGALDIYRTYYGNLEGLSVGRAPMPLIMLYFATEYKTIEVRVEKTMNNETQVVIGSAKSAHCEVEKAEGHRTSLTNIGRNPEKFLEILDHIPKLREIAEDFTTFLIFCYRIATYKMPIPEAERAFSVNHHLDTVFGMVVGPESQRFINSDLPDPYFYLNE